MYEFVEPLSRMDSLKEFFSLATHIDLTVAGGLLDSVTRILSIEN